MTIPLLEALLWAISGISFLAVFVLQVAERRRLSKVTAQAAQPPAAPGTRKREEGAPPAAAQPPAEKKEGVSAQASGVEEPMPIKKLRQRAMERQDRRIGEILMAERFITKEELEKALEHQNKYGGSVTQYLLHFGCIDEKKLAQCLSSQFRVPYLPLDAYEIADEVLESIPVDIAEKYWVMPVDRQGDSLMVAMIDPLDTEVIKDLERLTGLEIIPFVGIISEIVSALRLYYKVLSKDDGSPLMKAPPFFVDTKTYTGIERRQAIRYRVGIDIRFPLQDRYITAQTVDVSRGGFAFTADRPIELGTMLTLEINLPREVSPLPISAVTQVVRCVRDADRCFQLGVRTLKISKKENNLIISYAAKNRQGT